MPDDLPGPRPATPIVGLIISSITLLLLCAMLVGGAIWILK